MAWLNGYVMLDVMVLLWIVYLAGSIIGLGDIDMATWLGDSMPTCAG